MIKRTFLFLLTGILMAACGCSPGNITKLELNGDRSVTMRRGELLKIGLDANPTTGYLWKMSIPDGQNVVEAFGEREYFAGPEDLVGAGGLTAFTIKAAGEGTAEVLFSWERSWEDEPVKEYTLTVTVKGPSWKENL
jgi:predicted secreted protein